MATTTVTSLSTALPTPPTILDFAHAPALELRQPAAAHDDPLTLTNTVFSHTGIATFSNPLTYTSAGKPTLTTSTSVAISSSSSSLTSATSAAHSSVAHSSSSSSSSSPGTATATAASTSATTTAGSSNAALAPSIGAGKAVALVCALAGLVACGF